MDQSPFQLTFNYNDKQIINTNFTITMELYHDLALPINCGNNRYRLCLVELALQIKSDQMSIEIWCQSPALSFANFHRFQTVHTCILPAVNATQQPSITMIINSQNIGKIYPLATANFTYSSQYFIEKQGEIPINIVVRKNKNLNILLYKIFSLGKYSFTKCSLCNR
jgi:hypothetical protein